MPIDLDAIASDTVPVDVNWKGHVAKIKYRPSALTTRNIETMQAADDESETFLTFVMKFLADWDITKGKKKVPISVEGLRDVPLPFIRACVDEIMEDSGKGADEEGKA